jgi:Kef-type K+ transport system membrane component KefB
LFFLTFLGVFEWEYKYAVGWAMVGRGELGFVMAEAAFRSDLTSELTFSVTVWALLLATLLSPPCFRAAVGSYGAHSDQKTTAVPYSGVELVANSGNVSTNL